jgi:N-acetyl-alpha-D-glucosaminyl L-malate synthase BshA
MPAKLVMIGDGPDRGAAEYIVRKKRMSKDVFFLGKQDNIQQKLGVADLMFLLSDEESFGLAALEAMACEVPVVATNVGGIPEVITPGVDGYLVTPRDVAAAARAALDILTLPDRGRAMGAMARKNARRRYCANDIIPRYEAYYERVLNSSDAAASA